MLNYHSRKLVFGIPQAEHLCLHECNAEERKRKERRARISNYRFFRNDEPYEKDV